jgi:hypothetical protein
MALPDLPNLYPIGNPPAQPRRYRGNIGRTLWSYLRVGLALLTMALVLGLAAVMLLG